MFRSARVGRFRISLWRRTKILRAKRDFEPDREVTHYAAWVQHSRYNPRTRQWRNQSIWCDSNDLRSLVNALDRLNEIEITISSAPMVVSTA